MQLAHAEISERLRGFIARSSGAPAAVEVIGPLAGGASKAAYAVDITVGDGPRAGFHAAVLRMDLGGKIYESAHECGEEARVMQAVRARGVVAPAVLWSGAAGEAFSRAFLVMERVEGETIGRRIVRLPELEEARRALPRQMGEALAGIHATDPAPLPFLPRARSGQSPAAAAIERSRGELDRLGGAHPVLEAGWRWLAARAPPRGGEVLVHGDFRLGNLVVGPSGLRAILDWEFAARGDPHEDLAWPFVRDWRFGRDDLRFAGLSGGEDFLAAYERASGLAIDRASLAFWEALGNFRWALGCLTQARRHQSGKEPSVELASLGRRACEMELEMMDRIAALAAAGGG
jgi:aminoglycoside phosphotransferase (APT) family kinase protein